MGGGDFVQFVGSFGQGHIEDALAQAKALQQELQRQGGFAGPGEPFQDEQAIFWKSSAEDVIETGNTGGDARVLRGPGDCFSRFVQPGFAFRPRSFRKAKSG